MIVLLHHGSGCSHFWPTYEEPSVGKSRIVAVQAKTKMLYVAMFDEMDEGTAIFKCSNNPPAGVQLCDYERMPTDQYLWLTGQAGKMLRQEIPFSRAMPGR